MVVQASTASTTFSTGIPGKSPSATGATASRSSAETSRGRSSILSRPAARASSTGRTNAAATRAYGSTVSSGAS